MILGSSDYITGIPLIDDQHKQFERLVNKLTTDYNKGGITRETLNTYIKEIINYSFEHLDAEEYLMRSVKYPLYEEHVAKHNVLRNKVDNLISEIDSQELDIDKYVNNLAEWLLDWVKGQILNDDIKLAKFLRENLNKPDTEIG